MLLTVSTEVLANGTIKLPAGLDAWRNAAARLPLGRNEKLFFEILADLPNPCYNRMPQIRATVANWIRWNLEATLDQLTKQLKQKEINRLEVLRRILEQPQARERFIQFLKDTILKPRPDGRRPFKFLLEDRKR